MSDVISAVRAILSSAILFAVMQVPAFAWAEGSVRIVDQRDLLRAHAVVKDQAEVIIKLGPIGDANPVLVNVDGLAGEKSPVSAGSGEFRFSGITPGTWRISGLGMKQIPKDVELLPR